MLELYGISRAWFDLVRTEGVTGEVYNNRHCCGLNILAAQAARPVALAMISARKGAASIEADSSGVSAAELKILKGAVR